MGRTPSRWRTTRSAPRSPGFPWTSFFKLIRHFGIYHQKFAVVKAGDDWYGYCGGIDINPNRLDDIRHIRRGPYHDVHALVEGPAVHDIALSFEQRWSRDGGGTDLAFELAVPDPVVADEIELEASALWATPSCRSRAPTTVQPHPSRALAFAPSGDDTIADTMMAAIRTADEFIYIEDQYFTPPPEYREALDRKGRQRRHPHALSCCRRRRTSRSARSSGPGFMTSLYEADDGAGIVRIGYPRRHYTVADNELRATSGRLLLMQDLEASGGVDPTVSLGPRQRLPQPPFWVAIEGELMYVFNESTAPNLDPENSEVFQVVRGLETRLVKGGPGAPVGTRARKHEKGAAATVVDLAGIYVHSKMMIVDDVFLGIGSANVNRRGLYHDGEINVFSVSQQLKAAPNNPIAALRRRLWAEMLDLPRRHRRAAARRPTRRRAAVRPLAVPRQPLRRPRRPPDEPHVRRHRW